MSKLNVGEEEQLFVSHEARPEKQQAKSCHNYTLT